MGDQKGDEKPKVAVPPPPPRQPDDNLRGYIERGNRRGPQGADDGPVRPRVIAISSLPEMRARDAGA